MDLSPLNTFGEVTTYQTTSAEETASHIKDADIVITNKVLIKAKEMDERYDYRYSRLIYVFAQLVHAGYLSLEELEVLKKIKLIP